MHCKKTCFVTSKFRTIRPQIFRHSFSAFFGTGQLSMIKEAIDGLERPPAQPSNGDGKHPDSSQTKRPVFVSAIFVSTYRLSSKQRGIMEEVLEKPVLDRYNIVLQIFKRHARTREARLQVVAKFYVYGQSC